MQRERSGFWNLETGRRQRERDEESSRLGTGTSLTTDAWLVFSPLFDLVNQYVRREFSKGFSC
jgi:hypothetical protein